MNQVVPVQNSVVSMENASVREYFRSGNVAQMSEVEKDYVLARLCEKYGLDPILRPFDLISFQGGQKFYMTASATNQLANAKGLSRQVLNLTIDDTRMIARCTVEVKDPNGRSEVANGFIAVSKFQQPPKGDTSGIPKKVPLDGDDLANALLKLETKTKRRATLSFFGVMDAAGDYEDRPVVQPIIPQLSAPQLPRAQVVAEAETVAGAVLTNAEINSTSANPPPPPIPRRGRPPKGQEPTAAQVEAKKQVDERLAGSAAHTAEVEAQIPTIEVPPPPPPPPVRQAPPPPPPPVRAVPAVSYVKYSRTQNARQLVDTASKIFNDPNWASDEVKKSAVKAAIPELDGRVNLFVEGKTEILPTFENAMKEFLVRSGVIKAG